MRRLAYIKQETLSFSYHLADHCNLRCKGCDNYSSIAPHKFTNLKSFENDLNRIKSIMGDKISSVLLLGGEPLLNVRINEYMEIARKTLGDNGTEIAIVTNGVLLNQMSEMFWECCNENNIVVSYTQYPISNIPLEKLENKARQQGVLFKRYGRENEGEKTLQFDPFNLRGDENIDYNFRNCFHANKCIQLHDGKLYTCNIRAYAHIFCDYFHVDMELSDKDYIDIHSNVTADDILSFLSKPIPFCRYCNISQRDEGHVWRTSNEKASIYDWMTFKFDQMAAQELAMFSRTLFFVDREISENMIWNIDFPKRRRYKLIRFAADADLESYVDTVVDSSSFNKEIESAVIICQNAMRRLKIEKMLYQKGFRHIYLAAI